MKCDNINKRGVIMSNLFLDKRKKLNITRKDFCDALGLSKEEEKLSILWEKGSLRTDVR